MHGRALSRSWTPARMSMIGLAGRVGTAVLPTWWVPPTPHPPVTGSRSPRPGPEADRPARPVGLDRDRLIGSAAPGPGRWLGGQRRDDGPRRPDQFIGTV